MAFLGNTIALEGAATMATAAETAAADDDGVAAAGLLPPIRQP